MGHYVRKHLYLMATDTLFFDPYFMTLDLCSFKDTFKVLKV